MFTVPTQAKNKIPSTQPHLLKPGVYEHKGENVEST